MHKKTTPRSPLTVALLCLGYMALVLMGLRVLFVWAVWPLLVGTQAGVASTGAGPELVAFGPVFWSAFGYGALFDLRLAALLTLPLGVGLALPPVTRHLSFINVFGMYLPVLWVVLLVYVVDVLVFASSGQRVHAGVFAALQSSGLPFGQAVRVLWGVLWQLYPVVWLAVGITVAAGLVAAGLAWLGSIPLAHARRFQTAYVRCFVGAVLWVMALHGQPLWGSTPLQASALPFPPHSMARALATNPVQNIMDTLRIAP